MFLPIGGEHTGEKLELSPTTTIDNVGYMDSQSLEESLARFAYGIVQWKGFGYYP
jgi:hypothetical protein